MVPNRVGYRGYRGDLPSRVSGANYPIAAIGIIGNRTRCLVVREWPN
jgi:hypothetical protein